ncbi:MAG: hypothetical protein LBR69_03045 [Endomicrobium sp.]|nr:hypothetical protein [Endomicrobium sp.]
MSEENKEGIMVVEEQQESENEITEEIALNSGLSEEEIEMAKSRGIIKAEKPENKKTEEKPKETEPKPDPAKDIKKDPKEPAEEPKKPEEEKPLTIDAKVEVQKASSVDLEVKEEQELLKKYNPNERALYFRHKNERKKRQASELKLAEAADRIGLLEAQLKSYKSQEPVKPKEQSAEKSYLEDISDDDLLTGAEAKARIEKLLSEAKNKSEKPELTEEQQQLLIQQRREIEIRQALLKQEDEAKFKYKDFDEKLAFAAPIIQSVSKIFNQDARIRIDGETALQSMFSSDPVKILKAKKLVKDFSEATVRGGINQFGETASDIAYEIGLLIDQPGAESPANSAQGKIGAEKVEKAIANAGKQKSPGSLPGSGRRFIPYHEITPEDVRKMTPKEWGALPEDVKERLRNGG